MESEKQGIEQMMELVPEKDEKEGSEQIARAKAGEQKGFGYWRCALQHGIQQFFHCRVIRIIG